MPRPPIEVTDVLRAHARDLVESRGAVVSPAKRKVIADLVACRTAALGGHRYTCSKCDYEHFVYKPCGNRHCPKCQAAARAAWLEARAQDLLPVEYFHVVFTVPSAIARVALQNKKVIYDILFQASAQTLKKIAADPKNLGAQLGFIGLLHTWGQTLHHHPHIHYVIPGGGLSPNGERWVSCRPGFFLPVRVLSRLFRGTFLALLRSAFDRGVLSFQGHLASLAEPDAFAAYVAPTYEDDWVVYAKPPFGGPAQVLKYLARYTHRVAISNQRLLSLEGGAVRFRSKDYAHGNRPRTMTLSAIEFIRRFLFHVLPKAFVRIRHFGFLANPVRAERLAQCRKLLEDADTDLPSLDDLVPAFAALEQPHLAGAPCPRCKKGTLVRYTLEPLPAHEVLRAPPGIDSS